MASLNDRKVAILTEEGFEQVELTSRTLADLDAFNRKAIEEIAEGVYHGA